MKNAILLNEPLANGIEKLNKKNQKKQAKEDFKSKKFQNLNDAEKDDLLKIIAIQLGVIEE